MTSDIKKIPVSVLLDTNILISAIGFGGLPRQILLLVLEKKIHAVTSPILLAEFREVINKKFPKLAAQMQLIEAQIKKTFILVQPQNTLTVVRDKDDNRVLEAAVEGKCKYIITGDNDLLVLQQHQGIKILTPEQFLQL